MTSFSIEASEKLKSKIQLALDLIEKNHKQAEHKEAAFWERVRIDEQRALDAIKSMASNEKELIKAIERINKMQTILQVCYQKARAEPFLIGSYPNTTNPKRLNVSHMMRQVEGMRTLEAVAYCKLSDQGKQEYTIATAGLESKEQEYQLNALLNDVDKAMRSGIEGISVVISGKMLELLSK